MSEIVLQQTAADVDVVHTREQLAAARLRLTDRETELGQLRSQLQAFEGRYFREVGALYAELDELEARIAEREVDLYDSDAARSRAESARQRARDSHDAAFEDGSEAEEAFDPPPSLRTLFREVAKRIHPDFARDEAEQKYLTLLMARANLAYRRGDMEALQRLLEDQREIDGSIAADGAAAELLRTMRQVRQVERDLAAVEAERLTLLAGEVARLSLEAQAVALEHRDLLAEMAAGLREQIADAERRFEFLERQMNAHGR
jgi:hypothetical protein